jgi:hypothetical protein
MALEITITDGSKVKDIVGPITSVAEVCVALTTILENWEKSGDTENPLSIIVKYIHDIAPPPIGISVGDSSKTGEVIK